MWTNTKLLVTCSFLIIISGFSFLWFGLKSTKQSPVPILPSAPLVEFTQVATPSAVSGISAKGGPASGWEGERVFVSKVVDGDTIDLEDGRTVRFVGIDTPETVDPRRPVGCFGKEASNETKSLLSGKQIILQKDVSDQDKYSRILRYVFLPLENGEMLFVNDYLVREGFAKVYTYPPDVKFDTQFRQAENDAKINKRGLWGKC